MADDTTRIINLTEATEVSDGMYLVTDASTGTRKLSLQKVLDKVGGNVADDYDATATYDVGDLCVYKGVLYECSTEISTAEAWNPDHWSRINLGDIVADIDGSIEELYEDKANESGEYDDIVAGTAKQLLSSLYTANDSPYIYRPTPADSDRERVKRLEGLSVGWNQIATALTGTDWECPDGSFSDGVITWTPTARYSQVVQKSGHGASFINGHKYLLVTDIKCPTSQEINIYISGAYWFAGTVSSSSYQQIGGVISYTGASGASIINVQTNKESDWGTINLKNLMCIDLTTLFGSTIADHIYTLEQATEGSGVAWVKQYIDLDSYHAYSTPTIKSVEGLVSHDMVGWNQWDEEWEEGTIIASTGIDTASSSQIRSKNYIPVFPSTAYFYSTQTTGQNMYANIIFYDVDKNYIDYTGPYSPNSTNNPNYKNPFTTPVNCRYIRVAQSSAYGATYKNDICINLSDPSRNGTYEPYEKHSYPLDSTITLRGIPKLVDGKLVADGDWYEPSGKQTVRYGEVTLDGTQAIPVVDWRPYEGTSAFLIGRTVIPSVPIQGWNNLFSDLLPCLSYDSVYNGNVGITNIGANPDYSVAIRLPVANLTTGTQIKEYLAEHPLTIVYEKATPTTSTASPYAEVQICDGNGTEEFVTDSVVPVGNVTEYAADLRRQVENIYGIPKPPTTDGDYALKLSIADGVPTYSWESEE